MTSNKVCDCRLSLIQQPHGFERNRANDLQALRTKLVYRVLRSVPEDVVITILQIDQISTGHAPLHERRMIISDFIVSGVKIRLISELGRCTLNHSFWPRS